MIIVGVAIIVVILLALGFVMWTLNTRLVQLNMRLHNCEVECFSPLAEVSINGEKKIRLTLCGAVKPIFDILNNKSKRPKIIIPGISEVKLR